MYSEVTAGRSCASAVTPRSWALVSHSHPSVYSDRRYVSAEPDPRDVIDGRHGQKPERKVL
jgi:hypothetical protein